MAINNPYVPGDPFSYDLKWLVRKVKELITVTQDFDEKVEQAVEEYIDNLQIPTDYINVMEPRHGLQPVVGDGVTDDTIAFKAIISYCLAQSKPLYIPQFCNVLITDDIKMLDMPNLILQGTISGDPALEVQISYDAQTTDAITWDVGTIDGPTLKLMGAKNATIRVQKATELELYADGSMPKYYSCAYNTLLLGNIQKLEFASVSGGWINENVFLNGRMTTFVMDGDYVHNNNIFYRPTFETATFDIIKGSSNYFYDVRLEGSNTIHFHEYATSNVMTRTWLSTTPTVSLIDTPYTDDNGTNLIIISTSAFNNYDCLEITKRSLGLDYRYFYKTATGLHATGSYKEIAQTDLIPIDKGVCFRIFSDANIWRCYVQIYDYLGNRITTPPGTSPLYLGSMSWDNVGQSYYLGSNTQDFTRGFCRYKYGVDTGVAYIKIGVTNANSAGDFSYLNLWLLTSKLKFTTSQFKLLQNFNTLNAAPTVQTGEVGDILFANPPTAGGPLGWICTAAGTPGTWKQIGTISS